MSDKRTKFTSLSVFFLSYSIIFIILFIELELNLILLKIPNIKNKKTEHRSTLFGDLYQTRDLTSINKSFIKLVSKNRVSSKHVQDLIFSLKVVKHLKSNAVVLSKNKQTLGLGHGQTNRVDALKFAMKILNLQ